MWEILEWEGVATCTHTGDPSGGGRKQLRALWFAEPLGSSWLARAPLLGLASLQTPSPCSQISGCSTLKPNSGHGRTGKCGNLGPELAFFL